MCALLSRDEVVEREALEIQKRRKEAGTPKPDPKSNSPDNLVGLAISGGGIRSAMFNLGVLQVFHARGLMKWVDYLSSVSGGSYIAAYYSLLGHFGALNPAEDGRLILSEHDREFVDDGKYLWRPIPFIVDYLRGTIGIMVLMASGLIAAASCVALFMRYFDSRLARRILELVDCNTDFWAAVAGGFALALVLWAIQGVSIFFSRSKSSETYAVRIVRGGLRSAVIAAGCAVAIMIGNGDFYLWSDPSRPAGVLKITWFDQLHVPLLIGALIFLIIAARPKKLLASEQITAPLWKKVTLRIILAGAVAGTVLSAVGWVGREDISGFASNRPPELVAHDTDNWPGLIAALEKDLPPALSFSVPPEELDPFNADETSRDQLFPLRKEWHSYWKSFRIRVARLWTHGSTHITNHSAVETSRTNLAASVNKQLFADHRLDYSVSRLLNALGRTEAERILQIEKRMTSAGDRELLTRYIRRARGDLISGATDLEKRECVRLLLEARYPFPGLLKSRRMVSTPIVLSEDQWMRGIWLAVSLLVFVPSLVLVDLNRASGMRTHYKKSLEGAFVRRAQSAAGQGSLPSLHELDPHSKGRPYPLFSTALYLPGRQDRNAAGPLDHGSDETRWYSFLMSPLFSGWWPDHAERPRQTYASTEDYCRQVSIADVVSLSGAALSAWMAKSVSLTWLMHFFGVRLEQWFTNPTRDREAIGRVAATDVLHEYGEQRGLYNWKFGVVADGGFREFLGVEELVARKCRLIIVSDAGCNNGLYEFGVMSDLVRLLRIKYNVDVLDLDHELPLDVDRLKRRKELDGRSAQHFVVGRLRYNDLIRDAGDETKSKANDKRAWGLLVYMQMSLTGDEDVDLEQFRNVNPTFPDEPTSNQFYDRDQVDSFIQLGQHIALQLLQRFDPSNRKFRDLWDAMVGSYVLECREERLVASNDAGPDWPRRLEKVSRGAIRTLRKAERSGEAAAELADYASSVLDGIGSPKESFKLTWAKLGPLAVECNRRLVGFRKENPGRFFRVGGRRMLLHAVSKCKPIKNAWMNMDERERVKHTIKALAELSVLLPRAVFRMQGDETATDLVICGLGLGECESTWSVARSLCTRPNKFALRRAIRTGICSEVEAVLAEMMPPRFRKKAKQSRKQQEKIKSEPSVWTNEDEEDEPSP